MKKAKTVLMNIKVNYGRWFPTMEIQSPKVGLLSGWELCPKLTTFLLDKYDIYRLREMKMALQTNLPAGLSFVNIQKSERA
jgi:hypothetical protein